MHRPLNRTGLYRFADADQRISLMNIRSTQRGVFPVPVVQTLCPRRNFVKDGRP